MPKEIEEQEKNNVRKELREGVETGNDTGSDNMSESETPEQKADGVDQPDDKEGDKKGESSLSDREADLLKDLMKNKDRFKATKAELEQIRSILDGIDPAEAVKAVKTVREMEMKELEAKGQFEEVKRQMVESHNSELSKLQAQLEERENLLKEKDNQIKSLTIGSSFNSSKFIAEQLVLPPSKAQVLFGEHFDFDGEKVVAYNKPRGAEGRAPLVDSSGKELGFDDAIKKLVESDPDSDRLIKAKIKQGADSSPSRSAINVDNNSDMSRTQKISRGLQNLKTESGPL